MLLVQICIQAPTESFSPAFINNEAWKVCHSQFGFKSAAHGATVELLDLSKKIELIRLPI